MGTEKSKILIVEDDLGQFRRMKTKLETFLGEYVEVYPKETLDETQLTNYNFFIDSAKKEQFGKILKFCKEIDIDIFIIDNSLINSDSLGCKFRDEIRSQKYRGFRYFLYLVSSTYQEWVPIKDWDKDTEEFVSKIGHTMLIPTLMLNKIAAYKGIAIDTLYKTGIGTPDDAVEKKETDKLTDYDKRDEKRRNFVNRWIVAIFYFLLALTSLNALVNITAEFGSSSVNNVKSIIKEHFPAESGPVANDKYKVRAVIASNDAIANAQRKNQEKNTLESVEEIYIYILPIFIVFGFYNYYKASTSVALLMGNERTVNPKESTRTMKVTKVLFISSMISYVVIKVIQVLFSGDASPTKLIGAGMLILILMLYFIFLENYDNKNDAGQKSTAEGIRV